MSENIIKWKSEFNTGIQRIDFEHRIFLELVNSFKIALDKKRPKEELVRILTEIEQYAVFHFISEENCMFLIGYPDLKEHQIQHFELLEKFNLTKYEKQGFSKFYDFIKNWFINHTIFEDMKLKKFISENNIDIDSICYNISI
uniref:bacteriohemerythrin n=1 Tax=uncultured Draconibacterium sp. TaxID=1573823 RepID=UPI0032176464